jgi:hypothetical protein
MIRMLGIIEDQPLGVKKSTYDRLKNDFQKKVGLGEGLDPVGSEDGDVDNDGDTDKSDDYLANRRKKISKAMKNEETIEELDDKTVASYRKKAKDDVNKPDVDRSSHKFKKRIRGIGNANDKIGSARQGSKTWTTDGGKKATRQSDGSIKYESKMNQLGLKQLVKEEYIKIQKEAAEAAPKIEKKLHECREKMVGEFFKREKVGTTFEAVMEKRLQVNTVAEMIDVPVNELILYFLNNVKTMNERALVEYRLGHVYFYAQ